MTDDLLVGYEDALITQNVAYRYAYAKKADISAVFELFDKELTKFPKKIGWWDPPKNLAINSALMGINLWTFTILPFHSEKRAYHPKTDRLQEGVVLHPNWDPFNQNLYPDDNLELATKLVKLVKTFNQTLQEVVVQELKWIETKFGVQIPDFIGAKLKVEIQKIAARRWSANRLRVKDILIPFDGSKAIELGMFDR